MIRARELAIRLEEDPLLLADAEAELELEAGLHAHRTVEFEPQGAQRGEVDAHRHVESGEVAAKTHAVDDVISHRRDFDVIDRDLLVFVAVEQPAEVRRLEGLEECLLHRSARPLTCWDRVEVIGTLAAHVEEEPQRRLQLIADERQFCHERGAVDNQFQGVEQSVPAVPEPRERLRKVGDAVENVRKVGQHLRRGQAAAAEPCQVERPRQPRCCVVERLGRVVGPEDRQHESDLGEGRGLERRGRQVVQVEPSVRAAAERGRDRCGGRGSGVTIGVDGQRSVADHRADRPDGRAELEIVGLQARRDRRPRRAGEEEWPGRGGLGEVDAHVERHARVECEIDLTTALRVDQRARRRLQQLAADVERCLRAEHAERDRDREPEDRPLEADPRLGLTDAAERLLEGGVEFVHGHRGGRFVGVGEPPQGRGDPQHVGDRPADERQRGAQHLRRRFGVAGSEPLEHVGDVAERVGDLVASERGELSQVAEPRVIADARRQSPVVPRDRHARGGVDLGAQEVSRDWQHRRGRNRIRRRRDHGADPAEAGDVEQFTDRDPVVPGTRRRIDQAQHDAGLCRCRAARDRDGRQAKLGLRLDRVGRQCQSPAQRRPLRRVCVGCCEIDPVEDRLSVQRGTDDREAAGVLAGFEHLFHGGDDAEVGRRIRAIERIDRQRPPRSRGGGLRDDERHALGNECTRGGVGHVLAEDARYEAARYQGVDHVEQIADRAGGRHVDAENGAIGTGNREVRESGGVGPHAAAGVEGRQLRLPREVEAGADGRRHVDAQGESQVPDRPHANPARGLDAGQLAEPGPERDRFIDGGQRRRQVEGKPQLSGGGIVGSAVYAKQWRKPVEQLLDRGRRGGGLCLVEHGQDVRPPDGVEVHAVADGDALEQGDRLLENVSRFDAGEECPEGVERLAYAPAVQIQQLSQAPGLWHSERRLVGIKNVAVGDRDRARVDRGAEQLRRGRQRQAGRRGTGHDNAVRDEFWDHVVELGLGQAEIEAGRQRDGRGCRQREEPRVEVDRVERRDRRGERDRDAAARDTIDVVEEEK